eukprot:9202053-Alexandrium_andersonii.AAC.1
MRASITAAVAVSRPILLVERCVTRLGTASVRPGAARTARCEPLSRPAGSSAPLAPSHAAVWVGVVGPV